MRDKFMLKIKALECMIALLLVALSPVFATLPNQWSKITSAYNPSVMFNPRSMYDPYDVFNPLNFISPFNIHNGILSEDWNRLPEEAKIEFRVNTCKIHIYNLGKRDIPSVVPQLKNKQFVIERIIKEEMTLEQAMAQIPRYNFGLIVDREKIGRLELIYHDNGEYFLVQLNYVPGIRIYALIRDEVKKCSINDYQLGLPIPLEAPHRPE